ncbi:MAG TPA: hypothetical protein ENI76_00390 [Ignavibacteria bacterium]|nr:hypothetical protein [Ignavibacteria bacterium]
MRHDKITKKVEQIEKVSDGDQKIVDSITEVIKKFNINSVFTRVDTIKRCGILISTIGMALTILPFIGHATVSSLFKSGLNKIDEGQKDAYYEMKNNPRINWRLLLLGLARRFIYLTGLDKEDTNSIKALILDDTTLEKTGKHLENAGYVFDHVTGLHLLGYKLLVCGYWDGVSFIPIDFSFHKEKRDNALNNSKKRVDKKKEKVAQLQNKLKVQKQKAEEIKEKVKQKKAKNKANPNKTNRNALEQKVRSLDKSMQRIKLIEKEKEDGKEKLQYLENTYQELKSEYGKCGLKKQDYATQYKKQRSRNTPGYKRNKETNGDKIDSAISMVRRALKNGFGFDYILTDSWFFCAKFLRAITYLGKKIYLVSMAPRGNAKYKILPSGKYLNPNQILNLYRTKAIENRRYKAKYIKLQTEYQGIRVVAFLIRIGKGENWRLLVSTHLNISFNKIMEVYKIRWTIEVFFKEAKQYLLLGKSQSRDFDAQIADTTLSFIRYLLLSYYERTHYGITIGGLFRQISQASVEENLVADLTEIFMELLILFAELAGIDFMTVYEELIRQPELQASLERLKIIPLTHAA